MMKQTTIAAKILLAVGLCLGVATCAIGALTYELKSTSNTYENTLNLVQEAAHQQDAARQVQVNFRKQVQEWKDILLRGYDPKDLAKYTNQFHQRASDVLKLATGLRNSIAVPAEPKPVEDFVQAFGVMRGKYEAALAVFVKNNGNNPRDIDKLVKGQDRAATDLLNKVVELMSKRTAAAVAEALTAQASTLRDVVDQMNALVGTAA